MKILIVTKQFFPQFGGVATYVANIINHWPDKENNIVVLTKKLGAKDKDTSINIKYSNFNKCILLFNIWRLAKKEKVDLIHLHCANNYFGCSGWFINKIIKKPYRLFLHSVDFNYIKSSKWHYRQVSSLSKRASEIIVNSKYLKNLFNQKFENITQEIKVVYPGPSKYFFEQETTEIIDELRKKMALEGKKIVLTVARLDEGKGFPHLISILPKVLEKIPNLVWIIIGDGKKKDLFIDLIKKNGLQNIIRYVGVVPNNELPKYYQLADLFVLLTHPDTEAEDDWATVFTEASASGLPILAGQVGGTDESVINLQTGIIVDVNQKQAVINGMVELLNNDEYAKKIGEQGKEWVKNNFDWDEEIKKLVL